MFRSISKTFGFNLVRKKKLIFSRQLESLDCAPACLKMIASYHGKSIPLDYLRDVCKTGKLGTSIYTLTYGAGKIGLDTVPAQMKFENVTEDLPFPAIILWNKNHFVVLVKILKPSRSNLITKIWGDKRYLIADPSFGMLRMTEKEVMSKWLGSESEGVMIFMEPNEEFNLPDQVIPDKANSSGVYFKQILKLVLQNRIGLLLILAGMLISSAISLAFPILTQRIVDVGIHFGSNSLLQLILVFQLSLFLGMIFIDVVKSTLLLHIGTKIEVNLTYDFLSKLMRLPLYFFDRKMAGDLMQRISDNGRIQNFIKTQLLDFVVAIASLITLCALMLSYNTKIFVFYTGASILGITWAFYFIRKRELLDYRRFDANTENADNLIETIVAMPEIKLNNAEEIKKDKWQRIQLKLFKVNTKITLLQQYQNTGSSAINQLKNITVTFFAAQQVVAGNISLGQMIALAAIVGQLNLPLYQIVGFIQYLQEARISFQRMAEIQSKKEEDNAIADISSAKLIPITFDQIKISALDFSYSEDENDLLFKDLSLTIPKGKVTALVGSSGSGKTTLLKLLLKFYEPLKGSIELGDRNLVEIPATDWRRQCGVVMQEGHIFGDTVENNIAMSTAEIDKVRMKVAAQMSCIDTFIEELPMGYSTKIGGSGIGISTGQKQRILIARAIYKNPEILFFDEATSALDAINEKNIQQNLEAFFKDKTVLLVAHRLSTVKNADNIIVLESGKIIEQGEHQFLINKKGTYYQLIKNQLELGT